MALTNVKEFLVSKRNGKGTSNPDYMEMEAMAVGDMLYYSLDDKGKYWYNHARYRMIEFGKKNDRKYEIRKGKAEVENSVHPVNVMKITRVL
jgi:hypothetical protein